MTPRCYSSRGDNLVSQPQHEGAGGIQTLEPRPSNTTSPRCAYFREFGVRGVTAQRSDHART